MLPRYLILDVDDTLTLEGRLRGPSLQALEQASAAGIDVILNTGRSAGWGAALLAYLPGVSAVVVENGGAWFDRRLPPLAGATAEQPVQLRRAGGDGEATDTGLRGRLVALRQAAADRQGLPFVATADDPFRLTDHTVIRSVPGGDEGAAVLGALRAAVRELSAGAGDILASSVHIHFFLDGDQPRSKAEGVAALLARRGVADPHEELARWAVAVGDSGNDASFFAPGRFALPAAVRNIERYLPELGAAQPRHITRAAEGLGLAELVGDLLQGRLGV